LTHNELDAWATAYVERARAGSERARDWADEEFKRADPESRWVAILAILEREPGDDVVPVLAAGPLEDLIREHGEQFIERIETEARRNAAFRHLLGGVWMCGGHAVWTRVDAARLHEAW
jgi:hypothetical protein